MTTDPVVRLQSLDRFQVRQRITPMVNRYEIREPAGGGRGDLLALAQQKRIAIKEQVTFYSDENRSTPVFSFRSRSALDVKGVTDVIDITGKPIGTFRKDFAASLLRSTWHVDQPGLPTITGVERAMLVALLRRTVAEFLPYHFDFRRPDGSLSMSVVKKFAFGRDSYDVFVHDRDLDRRLAASVAVALDALQAR